MTTVDTNQLERLPWELLEKIVEQLPVPDILGLKQVRNDILIRHAHDIKPLEGEPQFL